jgi:hypothetical protein
MFSTTFKTVPIDPYNRSEHLGIVFTRGGAVTLDQYFLTDTGTQPELAKFVVSGTAGAIVFQFPDGQFGYYPAVTAGQLIPVGAIRVVTNHTFNSVGLLATTATGIWWFGGA